MYTINRHRITGAAALRRGPMFAVIAALTTLGMAPDSVAAEAPSKPAGYSIDGVDVSKHQHPNGAAIDWSKVKAAGVEFATVRATRGINRTDQNLKTDLEAAQNAGLAVAPYHFFTGTDNNEGDSSHNTTGDQQADKFIMAVREAGYTGQRRGDLPPVLDLEIVDVAPNRGKCPEKISVASAVADVKGWLDKVEATFKRKPIIYTSKVFMHDCLKDNTAFAAYQLQVADWSSKDKPALPKGSTTWTMWQYTDKATRDGITNPVTADVFHGTQSDLNSLANR
ncbi:MAG: glycoside hydrolase family 25 protein [Pseudonocardiaceae bacterium]